MLTSLEREIADIIVECTGIEHLDLEILNPERLLFDGELGLDSIDALEIGVALHKRYGVRVRPEDADVRKHFATLRALAALVEAQRVK